jgi:Xaa-Pro aminopeptidase
LPKTIYTRRDIQELADQGIRLLHVDDNVIVTMEAAETAGNLGIAMVTDTSAPGNAPAVPLAGLPDLRHRARNMSTAWTKDWGHADIDLPKMRLARLARLREEMQRADVGAVLLTDPVNIRYASDARNMTPFHLRNPARTLFVPVSGPVVLFEFEGCTHLAEGLETIDEIRPGITVSYVAAAHRLHEKAQQWAAVMDDLLKTHACGKRVGMECQVLGRVGLERFSPIATQAMADLGYKVADAQHPIERARAIKTPEELKAQIASMRAVETGVHKMREALRPGMSENELWAHLHKSVIEQDGEYIETRLLTSGPRTNPWFQETGPRAIETGDLVSMDTDVVGPYGYYADFSRTFYCGTGRATPEQKDLYRHAVEQVEFNVNLMRPGMTFREFTEKSWSIPERYYKNRYFVAVHGVGMTGEYPYILDGGDFDSAGYDGVIEPGMTLCIESYIGEDGGREGAKFEQQVLVTDTGIQPMSIFPDEDNLLS